MIKKFNQLESNASEELHSVSTLQAPHTKFPDISMTLHSTPTHVVLPHHANIIVSAISTLQVLVYTLQKCSQWLNEPQSP